MSAALVGCPVRVASQHNPASTYNPIMRWLDLLLGTLGVYTKNIAVSHTVEKSFGNFPIRYRRRLRVIPNGVPLRSSTKSKGQAREYFRLPQHVVLLGCVGRLSEQKNQDFLFPAIKRMEDVHLVLAGDGECRSKFTQDIEQASLSQRVHILGSIREAEIPEFLAALDLFVLPSRYEGMPLALLEAMHAGVPIVASDIPSVREVMDSPEQEATGLILPIESDEVWEDAVRDILTDEARFRRIAEAAQRRGQEFSLDHMVDRYEACLIQ